MRLGYVTNGLQNHELDDALDLLAELGYRGVGLTLDTMHLHPWRTTEAELDRLAAGLAERGLEPAIETGARFLLDGRRKHEPTLVSRSGRPRRLEMYRRAVAIGQRLGARVVSLWSGGLRDDVTAAEARPWLVDGLRRTCDAAADAGLVVGFEPEPGMLIERVDQFRELAAEVAHPAFRLTIDLGHLECVEDAPYVGLIEDCADVLVHVHVDDIAGRVHHHLPIGEGEIDFAPLFEALGRIGYDGLALVELSRDSHRAPEVARDAIARLGPLLPGRSEQAAVVRDDAGEDQRDVGDAGHVAGR